MTGSVRGTMRECHKDVGEAVQGACNRLNEGVLFGDEPVAAKAGVDALTRARTQR